MPIMLLYPVIVVYLTYSYLETQEKGNRQTVQIQPDQTPHNVASDQGLHCLLTGFSIKNRKKATK